MFTDQILLLILIDVDSISVAYISLFMKQDLCKCTLTYLWMYGLKMIFQFFGH